MRTTASDQSHYAIRSINKVFLKSTKWAGFIDRCIYTSPWATVLEVLKFYLVAKFLEFILIQNTVFIIEQYHKNPTSAYFLRQLLNNYLPDMLQTFFSPSKIIISFHFGPKFSDATKAAVIYRNVEMKAKIVSTWFLLKTANLKFNMKHDTLEIDNTTFNLSCLSNPRIVQLL